MYYIAGLYCSWNEWVTLPIAYSDLPRDAVLAMTILDCAGPGRLMVVGGTTISLFGKHGMFRQVNIVLFYSPHSLQPLAVLGVKNTIVDVAIGIVNTMFQRLIDGLPHRWARQLWNIGRILLSELVILKLAYSKSL